MEMKKMSFSKAFLTIRNGKSIKQSRDGGGIPITRIETIAKRVVNEDKFGYANVNDVKKYHEYYLNEGDILFSHINSLKHLGKTAFYKDLGYPVIHGMNLLCLKVNKSILDPLYAFYFLQTNLFRTQMLRYVKKSVNQVSLPISSLKKVSIYFPSLPNQKRIAKVLSHCEDLIAKRKESIDLLDEFVKSTFWELFGDDLRNNLEWRTRITDVVSSIDSGWSPKCESRPRSSENEWAVLKLSSVTYKHFDATKNKACYPNTIIKKHVIPNKGDLLFSRKNTYHLVGATAFVYQDYEKLLLPDTIFRLNYKRDKIQGIFLWFLLNDETFSKRVRNLASGAAGSMPNISKSKLLKLKIPLPSMVRQKHFVQIIGRIEDIREQFQISLLELEHLYGSLSQQAFNGELDLSKVEIDLFDNSNVFPPDTMHENVLNAKKELDLGKLIKKNFNTKLFSIEDLEKHIIKMGYEPSSIEIKNHLQEWLKNQILIKVYDEELKKMMFKLN